MRTFQSLALECENFAGYAVHGDIRAENIDATATKLHRKYANFIERLGVEHGVYDNKNAETLTNQLNGILRAEKFIEAKPEEQPEPDEQQQDVKEKPK